MLYELSRYLYLISLFLILLIYLSNTISYAFIFKYGNFLTIKIKKHKN